MKTLPLTHNAYTLSLHFDSSSNKAHIPLCVHYLNSIPRLDLRDSSQQRIMRYCIIKLYNSWTADTSADYLCRLSNYLMPAHTAPIEIKLESCNIINPEYCKPAVSFSWLVSKYTQPIIRTLDPDWVAILGTPFTQETKYFPSCYTQLDWWIKLQAYNTFSEIICSFLKVQVIQCLHPLLFWTFYPHYSSALNFTPLPW